jgi:ribosomal protein S18 acetylase RimI-like enzyme
VPLPYLGGEVALAPDETCSFETWTDPARRGRGIGPALRAAVAARLAAEGNSRLLAMIYPENTPAIRLVEKLDYQRIGTVVALGPEGRRRLWLRMRPRRRRPGSPR